MATNPRWLPERQPLTAEERKELMAFFATLGVTPHQGQLDFMAERGKYKVLLCGRRWGKSRTIAMEVLLHIIECIQLGFDHGRVMLTAMNYKQITEESLEYLKRMLKRLDLPLVKKSSREGQFWLAGPVRIEVRSLANRKGLRGAGLTMLVVDECSLVPRDVFFYDLFPSVTDYRGRVLIAGTPAGLNWVVEFVEQLGLEVPYERLNELTLIRSEDNQVVMMRSPSWANPFLDRKEIERQRGLMPEAAFRQEYGAEILIEGSVAFLHSPTYVEEPPPPYLLQRAEYAVGLDYGYTDPSALVVVAKLPNGTYYVDRTVYERYIDAKNFPNWVQEHAPSGRNVRFVGDPSFWNKDGRHQIADYLAQAGLFVQPGSWDRVARWNMLRSILAKQALYIHESRNTDLKNEIENAVPKIGKPEDIQKPDHALSALTYALEALEQTQPQHDLPEGTYGWLLQNMLQQKRRARFENKLGLAKPSRRWS